MSALKKSLTKEMLRRRGKTSSENSQPICDANDVLKAMLAMPFVLDDLAQKELSALIQGLIALARK
jgi:hypothetical protein